jgi:hypothetical protein
MRHPIAPSAAVLVLLLSSPARPALAADPTPSAATARAEGDNALRYYASGQWEEAYQAFARADAAFHAPTLVLYMAHTQKERGKLVEALRLYRRVVDEKIPSTAPLQFLNAQVVAREEIANLRKRIPVLRLGLTGLVPEDAQVTIDGERTPALAAQPLQLQLDAGPHVVEVRAGSAAPIVRRISLDEGATVDLALPISDAPAPPGDRARGPLTPALVSFGAAAVGLAVGAGTGAASLGKVAELRARCTADRSCPASAEPLAASAGRLADASTVAFVAGGALALTGVVLLVVRPGGARAVVGVGPQSIVITGAF